VSGSGRPEDFLSDFLKDFLESQLVSGLITTDEYYSRVSAFRRSTLLATIGQRLFAISPKPVSVLNFGRLRLIFLREPGGGEFPFLQGLAGGRPDRERISSPASSVIGS
jgi:hypothetical protein